MTDINNTLDGREKRYGSFESHSESSQAIKEAIKQHKNWGFLKDYHRESLEMIAHKIARILNGDPDYEDNWHDIAGYATLVEREIQNKKRS